MRPACCGDDRPRSPVVAMRGSAGHSVDWSAISNRDRAMMLLAQIDPGRITDSQRNSLIEMAVRDAPDDRPERGNGGRGSRR